MSEAAIYTDDYCQSFDQEFNFLDFIRAIDSRSVWKTNTAKRIRFVALEKDKPAPKSIQPALEQLKSSGQQPIITDTMKNTQLFLCADKDYLPVRNCAIKTILERARVNGNSLGNVSKDKLAKILNYCMAVAKGEALIKVSEGKVCAVHGGDESDYAILEIAKLFEHTVEYLEKNFPGSSDDQGNYIPGYEFSGATYEHSLVTATWGLTGQKQLLETYKHELDRLGLDSDGLKASIRLSTSDVGISGANLHPELITKGKRNISLGYGLKLEHKNKATIEDFDKKLSQLYAQYTKAINSLTNLLYIPIDNPYNTLLAIAKKIRIPKKLAYKAADVFQDQFGNDRSTAHDIYYGLAEVVFFLQTEGASGTKIVKMEETVARALTIKWEDFDIPGTFAW